MAYHQVDLAGLRQALQRRWDGVPFWTDVEANDAINEALHQWNILTGQWKIRLAITTTPNGPWIPLPLAATLGLHVEFNGKPLMETDTTSLDLAHPHWESDTTATGGTVPTAPRLWTPAGMYMIGIWPADAAGNNSLLVDGVASTPVLQTDADYLDLSQDEVDTLLGYALHVAAFSQGAGLVKATMPLMQAFFRSAAARNGKLAASDLYKSVETMDFRRLTNPEDVFGNNRPANPVVAATQGQ